MAKADSPKSNHPPDSREFRIRIELSARGRVPWSTLGAGLAAALAAAAALHFSGAAPAPVEVPSNPPTQLVPRP